STEPFHPPAGVPQKKAGWFGRSLAADVFAAQQRCSARFSAGWSTSAVSSRHGTRQSFRQRSSEGPVRCRSRAQLQHRKRQGSFPDGKDGQTTRGARRCGGKICFAEDVSGKREGC